ncbi:exodeoxyribonuclease VII small subunit [Candidatus Woesearchaeota archaeon]|nr:exodeoxyribonuclease VII small subunit [Nanoarchaeota archaeon]MCB9370384.1 exodeoxyribonuclease VII small subunit [Candidatus Woesearchaeota archaeon]USN44904.1 MAG: exodeoxyribonuclease VII small subunit [Candidatus Woesearchaeota archaeon]
MSYETDIKRIEEILSLLENGGTVRLDEHVALVKEGLALAKACREYLDLAELSVKKIISTGEKSDLELS